MAEYDKSSNMRVRVQLKIDKVQVDEVVEGRSEADITRQLRAGLEARAPFLVRLALRTMDDRTLWRRVVELHNRKFGAAEPSPATAAEFIAFGERNGYVTRLE